MNDADRQDPPDEGAAGPPGRPGRPQQPGPDGGPEGFTEPGPLDPDALLEKLPAAVCTCDRDGAITYFNTRAAQMWGLRPASGRPTAGHAAGRPPGDGFCGVHKLLRPDGRPLAHSRGPLAEVLRTGRAVRGRQLWMECADGTRRAVLLSIAPLPGDDGRIEGALACFQDVTRRVTAARRLSAMKARQRSMETERLLTAEMNHRVKNMLAMVQATATQMLRGCDDPQRFSERFSARLRSFANVHALLARSDWHDAGLHALLCKEFEPFGLDGGRVALTGPEVRLDAERALHFGLVIHELAANALCHGALSTGAGSVAVAWRLLAGDAGGIAFEWCESGGPEIMARPVPGLGHALIERTVARSLGGRCVSRFERGGASWLITLAGVPRAMAGA